MTTDADLTVKRHCRQFLDKYAEIHPGVIGAAVGGTAGLAAAHLYRKKKKMRRKFLPYLIGLVGGAGIGAGGEALIRNG